MRDGIEQVPAALSSALADRYRLERELGRGGMATVYLAHDLKHDRDVAIKVLHEDLGATLGPERFLTEIKTTAKLQHPHILPLLDSGAAGGLLFYVMPYVEGETLRDRLTRETQLPIDDAVRIAREVADALGFAHGHGIIHRDIKPENILLQGGHALVADFGIALAVQHAGGARLTQTGLSLGTPQYMAPEQAMGERTIGPAADIYALGAVTYEMLTGEPPFTGTSVHAIVARVMNERPTSITTLRDTVPEHMNAAVMKALAKLPADRWASATQLSEGLAGALDSAHARTAVPGSTPPRPRRHLAVAILLLLAGGAAGGVGARFAGMIGTSPAPSNHLSIVLPDSAPMAFVGEASLSVGRRSLALSPDGRTLVYVGWYRNRTHLFVRPLGEDKVRRLEGTEGAYGPFFSPSGKWVAFVAQQTLKKVAVDGGAPIELAAAPETYGGTWLEDGRILFARDEGRMPLVVSENGGAATRYGSIPQHGSPSAIPNSNLIIAGDTYGIQLLSPEDSVPRQLTANGFERLEWSTEMLPGASPQYLQGDFLIVAGDGRLHALPFSSSSAKALGPIVPLDVHVRQEVFGATAQFAIGGDGSIVYAPGANVERAQVVLADRQGRVDTLPWPVAAYWNPSFSPDGRRVAVTVRQPRGVDLQIFDLQTGARTTPLTSGQGIHDPLWSADGMRVLYSSEGWKQGSTMEIAETGGVATRRDDLGGRLLGLSADGSLAAVARGDSVGVLDVPNKQLVTLPRPGGWVEFSPDRKWVLWTAVGTRQYELFVSALPLGGPVFSVTPDGCMEGKWMPDGREVVCFQSDGYLYSVPLRFERNVVSGGTPRRLTTIRLLETSGRTWALSPDGRRMLFVAAPPGDSTRVLNVITNFRSEMEKRATEARGKPVP